MGCIPMVYKEQRRYYHIGTCDDINYFTESYALYVLCHQREYEINKRKKHDRKIDGSA